MVEGGGQGDDLGQPVAETGQRAEAAAPVGVPPPSTLPAQIHHPHSLFQHLILVSRTGLSSQATPHKPRKLPDPGPAACLSLRPSGLEP